ncbi:MAG: O-antigen ligase family protein [Pseudomonadota bacterium]
MSTMVYDRAPIGSGVQYVEAYEEPRDVPLWEQAGISIWLLFTYVELPGASPVRYLLLFGILAYAAMNYRAVTALVLKAWPIFLLPIFGIFSFVWADYPQAAFRGGLLYLITVFVPAVFAARVSLRVLLRCYFFAAAATVLWALQWWGEFNIGGPYASKNYLALHMTFAAFFFVTRAFDQQEHPPIRALALLFLPLSLLMIYEANSATATVMSLGGVLGLIMVRLFWLNLASMQYMKSIVLLLSLSLVIVGSLIFLSYPGATPIDDFLAMVGKDSTLTGRTTMWSIAEVFAEDRPMFGVGLGSFWQDAVGAAQTINENDHKPAGTHLTFHSSYWEVRVHLGLIGLGLYLIMLGWVGFQVVRQWLGPASVETSAILVITVITLAWSFTESWLWLPLNGATMLFFIGALAAVSSQKRQYLGRAKVQTAEAA